MPENILAEIDKEISSLKLSGKSKNVGKIESIGDGVATVSGLSEVVYNEPATDFIALV